jgi:hypothetical protein
VTGDELAVCRVIPVHAKTSGRREAQAIRMAKRNKRFIVLGFGLMVIRQAYYLPIGLKSKSMPLTTYPIVRKK